MVLVHDTTAEELEHFLAPGGGMEGLRQARAEGLVGHFGLGTHDRPHAPLHRRWLREEDADVLLTVNDFNVLRRYGAGAQGCLTAAAEKNAGVMNAGVFYMGMLSGIPPMESYGMGFKSGLVPQMERTLSLAQRQWEWCEAREISLGAVALQWAMQHPAVSTCIMGCRTAEEVHGVVDMAQAPIADSLWAEFAQEFDEAVAELTEEDHWWYVRGETEIS